MKRRELLKNLALMGVSAGIGAGVGVKVAGGSGTQVGGATAAGGISTWDQIMQNKVLRVGAAMLEPWYFKDTTNSDAPGKVQVGDQVWRGICPAIAQDVAEALGVRLEIIETTWGNAVAGLQSNQFDAMFMLDATPQRSLSVDFVQNPMLWYPMSFLAKEDITLSNWNEVNDPKYRIGVALGTNSDEHISAIAPKAQISRFQNSGEIFAAFQSGRIDLGMVSAVAVDLARAKIGMGKTIVPQPFLPVAGGIAVRKETDSRWISYLNTIAAYYYNTAKVQKHYEDFLAYRNIDAKTSVPVIKELWQL